MQKVYYPLLKSDTKYKARVGQVFKRKAGRYTTNNPYQSNQYNLSALSLPHFGLRASAAAFNTKHPPTNSDYNRLYEKVRKKIEGDKGELLTSSVEWKSSLDMITKRADVLRKAYLALRKFNLPEAARILSLSTRQRKKIGKKIKKYTVRPTPSQLWLEYWMGWAPLAGDIGLAVLKLTDNVNHQQRFSVGIPINGNTFVLHKSVNDTNYYQWGSKGRLTSYGRMAFTNPNAGLAHQLGFTNPVLTAWQILPFSFMVNWFINVDQVLGQLDNFMGVTLSQTGNSLFSTTSYLNQAKLTRLEGGVVRDLYFSQGGTGVIRKRTPGSLIKPRLTVELPKISLTRASTAISLLVEIFLIKSK